MHISFRGKAVSIGRLDGATPLAILKEDLEKVTNVPVANQKLIFKGKTLRGDSETLQEAGMFPATGEVPDTVRLMLVGSTVSELEVIRSRPPANEINKTVRNDLDRVPVPKGYKKIPLNHQPSVTGSSPYRFQRVQVIPGLPEEKRARQILESLADDPGIKQVLQKHKWTVGSLCELYPEGKVGVSATCTMGLNQNHGMKIFLRLRTDDLQGFRKILSIRNVLFHELAHNDFSDHDDNFYMLMRQVEREATELNWMQQPGGRTLSRTRPTARTEEDDDRTARGYVLIRDAYEGGSGRLGGDSHGLQHLFPAKQLAGQAAVQRLTPEEQEVEDSCGHSSGNKDAMTTTTMSTPSTTFTEESSAPRIYEEELESSATLVAPEADASIRLPGYSSSGQGLSVTPVADSTPLAGVQVNNAGSNRSLYRFPQINSPPVDETRTMSESGGEDAVMRHAAGALRHRVRGNLTPAPGIRPPERSAVVLPEDCAVSANVEEDLEISKGDSISGSVPSVETIRVDVDDDSTDNAPIGNEMFVPPSSLPTGDPPVSHSTTPWDELLAMGFPTEDVSAALAATGGSLPDAAHWLLMPTTRSLTSASTEEATTTAVRSSVENGNREVVRLSPDVRLQQAAETIAGHVDTAAAVQCVDTLTGVFRNLMEHPGEEKFRKICRSKGKFKASVASVPGGVDVLLAAGFEERGVDRLELGRRDPGLSWLAKSILEVCRKKLEKRAAGAR